MSKYGAATVDMWDSGFGSAATNVLSARPGPVASATTTTARGSKAFPIYIRGKVVLPKWFEMAHAALNAIAALPAGWNSYSAKEIDFDAVAGAVAVLLEVMSEDTPLPTFVPVSNGGVLLEWHTMEADLEVSVLPSGRVRVSFEKVDAVPVEVEGLPQEVAGPLKAFLQEV